MQRRLTIACLLLAWFCANGRMLDVAQCFAWARMFSEYAPRMPLAEAIIETLDPAKPCPLCSLISQARGQQESSRVPAVSADERLLLASPEADLALLQPVLEEWPRDLSRKSESRTEPVPLPPPRDVA